MMAAAKLDFQSVSGLPGVRKAEYRPGGSKETLQILELHPNVFHIRPAGGSDAGTETVVIRDVSQKKKPGGLIGILLDFLTTPPRKNCYTITIITQWPNGKTTIEHMRHCD
jgi:hypothetical protein